MYFEWLIGASLTCLLTVIAAYFVIPSLRSHKMGQYINEYMTEKQKEKKGTPTMCGICFIVAISVATSVFFVREVILGGEGIDWLPLAATLYLALANAAVGFLDDYLKLIKGQNEGLKDLPKLILTLIVAAGYVLMMALGGYLETSLVLPVLNLQLNFGWFYYPVAIVVIAGMAHSVNITDGIDGLAASLSAIVALLFLALAVTYGGRQIGFCGAVLLGGSLGFLVVNKHPAQAFMGDTGSLFLGGFIIGVGFMVNQPAVLVLAGFVFVIEMLTSLTQRLYFKVTHGKRLYKIAPLHHLFERFYAWSEEKIVAVYSAAAMVCCVAAFFMMNGTWIR